MIGVKLDGFNDGILLGIIDGINDGDTEGLLLGSIDEVAEGARLGTFDIDGMLLGDIDVDGAFETDSQLTTYNVRPYSWFVSSHTSNSTSTPLTLPFDLKSTYPFHPISPASK